MRRYAVVLAMAAAVFASCERVVPTAVQPTHGTPVPTVRAALISGMDAMSHFQVCSVGGTATYTFAATNYPDITTNSLTGSLTVADGDCEVIYTTDVHGLSTVNPVTVTLSSITTPNMFLSSIVGHVLFYHCTAVGSSWDCTTDDTPTTFTGPTSVTYNVNGDIGALAEFNFLPFPTCGTLTIGYWKTHAGFGPQADAVTPLLPQWLGTAGGALSVQVTTAAQAVTLLSMSGNASNPVNKLYAQLLAAKLNIAAGADGSAVAATIAAADAFLATHDATSTLTAAQKAQVLGWMTMLDNYNNGLIGPGHCGF